MRAGAGGAGQAGLESVGKQSADGGEEMRMKAPIAKPQAPENHQAPGFKIALMSFGNSQIAVPKGQLKIAQRFNAGSPIAPGQVPKGRPKGYGRCVQSALRDSNGIDSVPGVETPGYSRDVPPGHGASNCRKALLTGRVCSAVWKLVFGFSPELAAWDLELSPG